MALPRLTAALAAGVLAASGLAACEGDRESRNKSNPGDVPQGNNTVETNPTTLGSTAPNEETVTQEESAPTDP